MSGNGEELSTATTLGGTEQARRKAAEEAGEGIEPEDIEVEQRLEGVRTQVSQSAIERERQRREQALQQQREPTEQDREGVALEELNKETDIELSRSDIVQTEEGGYRLTREAVADEISEDVDELVFPNDLRQTEARGFELTEEAERRIAAMKASEPEGVAFGPGDLERVDGSFQVSESAVTNFFDLQTAGEVRSEDVVQTEEGFGITEDAEQRLAAADLSQQLGVDVSPGEVVEQGGQFLPSETIQRELAAANLSEQLDAAVAPSALAEQEEGIFGISEDVARGFAASAIDEQTISQTGIGDIEEVGGGGFALTSPAIQREADARRQELAEQLAGVDERFSPDDVAVTDVAGGFEGRISESAIRRELEAGLEQQFGRDLTPGQDFEFVPTEDGISVDLSEDFQTEIQAERAVEQFAERSFGVEVEDIAAVPGGDGFEIGAVTEEGEEALQRSQINRLIRGEFDEIVDLDISEPFEGGFEATVTTNEGQFTEQTFERFTFTEEAQRGFFAEDVAAQAGEDIEASHVDVFETDSGLDFEIEGFGTEFEPRRGDPIESKLGRLEFDTASSVAAEDDPGSVVPDISSRPRGVDEVVSGVSAASAAPEVARSQASEESPTVDIPFDNFVSGATDVLEEVAGPAIVAQGAPGLAGGKARETVADLTPDVDIPVGDLAGPASAVLTGPGTVDRLLRQDVDDFAPTVDVPVRETVEEAKPVVDEFVAEGAELFEEALLEEASGPATTAVTSLRLGRQLTEEVPEVNLPVDDVVQEATQIVEDVSPVAGVAGPGPIAARSELREQVGDEVPVDETIEAANPIVEDIVGGVLAGSTVATTAQHQRRATARDVTPDVSYPTEEFTETVDPVVERVQSDFEEDAELIGGVGSDILEEGTERFEGVKGEVRGAFFGNRTAPEEDFEGQFTEIESDLEEQAEVDLKPEDIKLGTAEGDGETVVTGRLSREGRKTTAIESAPFQGTVAEPFTEAGAKLDVELDLFAEDVRGDIREETGEDVLFRGSERILPNVNVRDIGTGLVGAGAVGVATPEPITSVGGAGVVIAGSAILGTAGIAASLDEPAPQFTARRPLRTGEIDTPEGRIEEVLPTEFPQPDERPEPSGEIEVPEGRIDEVLPTEFPQPDEQPEPDVEIEVPEGRVQDAFPTELPEPDEPVDKFVLGASPVGRQRLREEAEEEELGVPDDPFLVSDKRLFDPTREFGEREDITTSIDEPTGGFEPGQDIGEGIAGQVSEESPLFEEDFTFEPELDSEAERPFERTEEATELSIDVEETQTTFQDVRPELEQEFETGVRLSQAQAPSGLLGSDLRDPLATDTPDMLLPDLDLPQLFDPSITGGQVGESTFSREDIDTTPELDQPSQFQGLFQRPLLEEPTDVVEEQPLEELTEPELSEIELGNFVGEGGFEFEFGEPTQFDFPTSTTTVQQRSKRRFPRIPLPELGSREGEDEDPLFGFESARRIEPIPSLFDVTFGDSSEEDSLF